MRQNYHKRLAQRSIINLNKKDPCKDHKIGLLICPLISEKQGLEESWSASNLRKISGPANMDNVGMILFHIWYSHKKILRSTSSPQTAHLKCLKTYYLPCTQVSSYSIQDAVLPGCIRQRKYPGIRHCLIHNNATQFRTKETFTKGRIPLRCPKNGYVMNFAKPCSQLNKIQNGANFRAF